MTLGTTYVQPGCSAASARMASTMSQLHSSPVTSTFPPKKRFSTNSGSTTPASGPRENRGRKKCLLQRLRGLRVKPGSFRRFPIVHERADDAHAVLEHAEIAVVLGGREVLQQLVAVGVAVELIGGEGPQVAAFGKGALLSRHDGIHGGTGYFIGEIGCGFATYSFGVNNVCNSASINFFKAVPCCKVDVTTEPLHKGRSTAVIRVTTREAATGKLLFQSTHNMFLMGPIE